MDPKLSCRDRIAPKCQCSGLPPHAFGKTNCVLDPYVQSEPRPWFLADRISLSKKEIMDWFECACHRGAFRCECGLRSEFVERIVPVNYSDIGWIPAPKISKISCRSPAKRALKVRKLDNRDTRRGWSHANPCSAVLTPIRYMHGSTDISPRCEERLPDANGSYQYGTACDHTSRNVQESLTTRFI